MNNLQQMTDPKYLSFFWKGANRQVATLPLSRKNWINMTKNKFRKTISKLNYKNEISSQVLSNLDLILKFYVTGCW